VQFLEPRSAQSGGAQAGFGGNDGFNNQPPNQFPTGNTGFEANQFPASNSNFEPNQFPTGNSNFESNPNQFPSTSNPAPSNANSVNNDSTLDFNSTINISDDDLPF